MFFVTGLALVTGAVIGLATGGRPRYLGRHRLRAWWLVALGFGLQAATDRFDVGAWGSALVLVGAAALLVFAALNPQLVGIGVVAAGVAANALVIGVNAGMPVRPSAVIAAHITTRADEPTLDYGNRHHRQRASDRLLALSDIIALAPVHEVVSFGDLILAIGVAATVARLLSPPARHLALSGHPTVLPPPVTPASSHDGAQNRADSDTT